jgi:hypothetical protein
MNCGLNNGLKDIQKRLGCLNCRFSDKKAIKKSEACCQYMGGIKTDEKGKCLIKEK